MPKHYLTAIFHPKYSIQMNYSVVGGDAHSLGPECTTPCNLDPLMKVLILWNRKLSTYVMGAWKGFPTNYFVHANCLSHTQKSQAMMVSRLLQVVTCFYSEWNWVQ
jgi:hypothetical protein